MHARLTERQRIIIDALSWYGELYDAQLGEMFGTDAYGIGVELKGLERAGFIERSDCGLCAVPGTGAESGKGRTAFWVFVRLAGGRCAGAHYPARFPAQIFFLDGKEAWEIAVLSENDLHLSALIRNRHATDAAEADGELSLRYAFVIPDIALAERLVLPDAPCLIACVSGDEARPLITFYAEDGT